MEPQKALKKAELLSQLRELALRELSAEEIGQIIGITRNAVVGLVKRNSIKLTGSVNEKKRRAAVKARKKKYGDNWVEPEPTSNVAEAKRTPTTYYPKVAPYHRKPKATCCWNNCPNEPVAPGKPYCNIHK